MLSTAPLWEPTIYQPRVLLTWRRDKSSEHSKEEGRFKRILRKASMEEAKMHTGTDYSTVIEWKSAPDFTNTTPDLKPRATPCAQRFSVLEAQQR